MQLCGELPCRFRSLDPSAAGGGGGAFTPEGGIILRSETPGGGGRLTSGGFFLRDRASERTVSGAEIRRPSLT